MRQSQETSELKPRLRPPKDASPKVEKDAVTTPTPDTVLSPPNQERTPRGSSGVRAAELRVATWGLAAAA